MTAFLQNRVAFLFVESLEHNKEKHEKNDNKTKIPRRSTKSTTLYIHTHKRKKI